MLLNSVVQSPEFLATSFLQRRSIDYQLYVSTLNDTWSVETRFEAFNGFVVIVSRVGQSLNCIFSSSILNGMLQVNGFLCVRQACLAVYSYKELIPELFPVNNVSIKSGYVEFWKFYSCTIRTDVPAAITTSSDLIL